MDDLETFGIGQLDFKPVFYYRYVHYVSLCIPQDKIEHTLEIFNSDHNKLQFTIEIKKEGKIPFLNIWIMRKKNNIILTNLY